MPLGSLLQRDFLNPYSLSFFWDYGRVSSHNANYATRMLSGMGVELSAQYKYFETSLTYATVTHKSEELRDDGAFYLNTSFTHTF
jgi:hemolysin activation/secretion protein